MRNHRFNLPSICWLLVMATPSLLLAQVSLSITVGPPPIPVYEQPVCPDNGYTWTPGYWAWGDDGYFWVPGTWVRIPQVGLLWTPGYWGWGGDSFRFHEGYWGPNVGFYGGINYGYGYGGNGYEGGHWQGRDYYYNRAVNNVNSTRITNVYNRTVIVNNSTHIAYNGGSGGVNAAPTPREQTAEKEHHVSPTTEQTEHHQIASRNKELLASVNRGKPLVAATTRPTDFSPKTAVSAKAAGGQVAEATLKATPKTQGPPMKAKAAEERPVAHPAPQGNVPPSATPNRAPGGPPPPPALKPNEAQPGHPIPDHRPTPQPAPEPNRKPVPHAGPEAGREPSPHQAPEANRKPELHPTPGPNREPARPPTPETERKPAPHQNAEPHSKPAPKPAPKPQPKPEPSSDKEEHPRP